MRTLPCHWTIYPAGPGEEDAPCDEPTWLGVVSRETGRLYPICTDHLPAAVAYENQDDDT